MRPRPSSAREWKGPFRAWLGALTLAPMLAWPVSAQAFEVFACEPHWAALVRELAPQVKVTSATHARQDPHMIEARPALISALRRADLAICNGASLEAGWLPMLKERSGNGRVSDGQPGMIYATDAVTTIDRPARVDPSMGDVHAEGNPHMHIDPRNVDRMAAVIAQRLAELDASHATDYRAAFERWHAAWAQRISQWEARAAPLKGRAVVAQHSGFAYLWRWLGMRQTQDLEPRPGVPPTMSHLQKVLEGVRGEPPLAIVQDLYQDPQPGQWFSQHVDRPLLALPSTVMAEPPMNALDGWFDGLIGALLRALPADSPRAARS